MARAIITGFFCLLLGASQQAWAQINLGQSTQNLTLTGLGPNASGDGVSQITWGACSYDGTKTTCTLSGPFTGLGPGGTYVYTLTYPGNGPSPLDAITAPGSDLFSISLASGSLTFVFNESNGTSVSYHQSGMLLFVPSLTSCTGNVATCGPGDVGQTPGATITGPVTGTLNVPPVIQTVISAGGYGGFTSIAPATWIEIYGQNLATTTADWTGGFQGNNAPTSVGGTTVTVGGKPLFIDYVSPGQVNGQVSSDVATGSQQVIVTTAAGSSAPFTINVNATEPGLLAPAAFKLSGTQYAVALFSDGFYDLPPGLVSEVASRRAVPGDELVLYGIGFGPVTPDNPAGVIEQNTNMLNASVDFSIGGQSAEVKYSGLTPTFVGLYQFNVIVPNIPANDKTPLTFTLNGTPGAQTMNLFIGN
ncbi:MAG: hypothetical protein ACLPWF_07335 [Bryobacteraceae bacterium]